MSETHVYFSTGTIIFHTFCKESFMLLLLGLVNRIDTQSMIVL